MFFNSNNAYKDTQRETKSIFRYELSVIVSLGRHLGNFFHGNCYVSVKYESIGNYPVNTQRLFNAFKTSMRRCIGVEKMPCV